MDERLFIAGCSDLAELKTWVADPQRFVENREKTWLVFSDQVPIWIKIGMLKILYSAAELAETGKKAQAAVESARQRYLMTHGQDSQKLVPAEAEQEAKQGSSAGAHLSERLMAIKHWLPRKLTALM